MQLRISSQMAVIGINISRPSIMLNSTRPRIGIETTPSALEIESPKPRLNIDQSQCFADVSHRGLADFAQYCSEYSRSEFFRGLNRTVAEGNKLAAIHTNFSVADLGEASIPEENEFEIICVPSELPRIEFDVQPVSYNYTPSKINLEVVRGQVDNEFKWGKAEIYVARPNQLDIQWIDVKA